MEEFEGNLGLQRTQDFHNMKRHLSKAGAVWIIITFVSISFSFTALAAMKKKFSMSIKMEKLISENYLVASGDFNNAIKQGINLNIIVNGKRK